MASPAVKPDASSALHERSDGGNSTPGGKRTRPTPEKKWLDSQLDAIALRDEVSEEERRVATQKKVPALRTPPASRHGGKASPEPEERVHLTCHLESVPHGSGEPGSTQEALGVWIVGSRSAHVVIAEIEPGTRAARSTLRAGDRIHKVNGVLVCSKAEAKGVLRKVCGNGARGAAIEFEVSRSRNGRLPTGWRQRVGEDGHVEYFKEELSDDGTLRGYRRSSRHGRDHPAIFDE